jgi:hypothetical protein
MTTHFLHIRKTGGSAVSAALAPFLVDYGIETWGHEKYLVDIPVGEKVFFGIRDPISRFVSGFNSRLRKGQPRNYFEWGPDEAISFSRFGTPEDLALSLSSPDKTCQSQARDAMQSIRHVRHRYADLFVSSAYLQSRAEDILMVLHQPDLDRDFGVLKLILGLPQNACLPVDPLQAHRTPPGFSTALSSVSISNLRAWYAADIELYETCMKIRETRRDFTTRQETLGARLRRLRIRKTGGA